jgi:adenylate cyclase
VKVGIGAHLGEVFAGALGDATRLEYTVIGDTVNIAERIEHLTRQADMPMLVSEALFDAIGEIPPGVTCTALPPQVLRGREKPIGVYAIQPSEDLLN